MAAASYSTNITTTLYSGTLTRAQKVAQATALGKNVDNYTDADFSHGADSGDSTAASNQTTKKNRTLWL